MLRGPAHSPACGTERSPASLARRNNGPNGACELQRQLQRSLGHLEAGVAHEVGGEAGRDAEVATAGLEAVQHGFDRPEPVVVQAGGVVAGGEDHLGVPDPLRLVLAELVREPPEVIRGPEQCTHRRALRDEVLEPCEAPAIVDETGRDRRARSLRELADGRDPHRALEVDVQLCLRQHRELAHPKDGSDEAGAGWVEARYQPPVR
jgi:hypothetical protein